MRIKKEDRVSHSYAGNGTVISINGKTENGTARVKWDNGGKGGAKIADLKKIED